MFRPAEITPDAADLAAARRRDEAAFVRLVAPHRAALQAHCYRMLGSLPDAEDALQEAMLRAWRGLPGFEGRSSLRSWLYRIATNVCLRLLERRPQRVLPAAHGPAHDPREDLDAPLTERVWIDPYPDGEVADDGVAPDVRYEARESVELAFIAALQHLPARQRAVLLLRDVLGFAPAEIAQALETSPAAVSSALQRAHAVVEERVPPRSQQATLRAIGDRRLRDVVGRYLRAWEESDVDAILGMLTADASFAMPPWATWFRGRADIGTFLLRRPLADARGWRLVPVRANGQVAFAFYELRGERGPGRFVAHGIQVVALDGAGLVTDVTTFLEASLHSRFGLPDAIRR